MVQVLTPRFQKKTTSQQFGEAFSRAAVGFTQHLAEKQKKEKEDEATARFLKEAYGIENTKGVPTDFLLQAQKGQQGINQQKAKYEEQGKQLQELGLDEEFGGAFSGNNQQSQNESEPDRLDRVNEQGEIKVGNVKVPTRKLIPESKIINAARINPSVADKLQKHNDNIREQERHEENLELKKLKESPGHKRDTAMATQQAKADTDYNKGLQESAGLAHIKTKTLTDLEKLNEKGVTGKPYEKLLEKMGMVAYTSEGRREFAADVKHMITDIRSILGAQFSNFEFQTILNAYPSADFSQGANRAIINNLKEFQDIKNKEIEFANQIKKNNGGKIPEDFQSRVNEKVKEYADDRIPSIKANMRKVLHEEYGIKEGNMLMFDPQGEPMEVPDEMIEQLLQDGATLP